jgi:tRNA dimethylallyltransferase
MPEKKSLIVVGGPTAAGKSAVAIALAKLYSTEIINADSRQVYAELNIGVNKPTKEELLNISHHLIGHVSIHQDYNAGLYEWDALNVINSIFQRNQTAVLVGGTGLYIKAVIQGFDEFPQVSTEIKKELNELYTLYGLEFIQQRLIEVDPEYAAEVDLHNPMRILRALEVSLSSGEKYSSLRARNSKNRNFKVIPVFISKDRTELYKIIDERVDFMVEKGLKQEAFSLSAYKHLKALQTVGYTEWFDFFEGKLSESEAINKIKQHTRNYAKRQWTWWKPWAWPEFEASQLDKIQQYIDLEKNNKKVY